MNLIFRLGRVKESSRLRERDHIMFLGFSHLVAVELNDQDIEFHFILKKKKKCKELNFQYIKFYMVFFN